MQLSESKLNILIAIAVVVAAASAGFAVSATAAEAPPCGLTYTWYETAELEGEVGQSVWQRSQCGCGNTTWGTTSAHKVTSATPAC